MLSPKLYKLMNTIQFILQRNWEKKKLVDVAYGS